MNQLGFPILSITVFLPLAGALVTLFLGHRRRLIQVWALLAALATLALAGLMWALFDYGRAGPQFEDSFRWIEALAVNYHVGLDGINLWLVLLTAFLSVVASLVSWRFLAGRPAAEARPFTFFLLALETGALGVFVALDLVLFYIFWEAMLVPAYFLIGRWGGARRAIATQKFVLYTMAGSALMLVAIITLAVLHYNATGALTFDLIELYKQPLQWAAQLWLFLAFALAFAVKAPLWPLHSWQPDAYVEAPTAVTVLLAGVLSKMGLYGLIRFCLPLFPDAVQAARPWIWLLAIVGILYGSLVALVQNDMKRLLAFSSLAHMGLMVAAVLAANTQGVQGALLQSVSHGITVAALFVLVELIELRRGTRLLDSLGGLWKSIPRLGTLMLIALLAALGLPGLSAFPGEFTMLVGLFQASRTAAVLAGLGMVLAAWYMLNLFRRAFAGPLSRAENRGLPDLRRREAIVVMPLVILIFLLGILPNLILRPTDAAVSDLLNRAEARRVVLMER